MLESGIAELLQAYRSRKISVSDYVELALDQAKLQERLCAFIQITADKARAWAADCDVQYAENRAGLLSGIPLAVKDNIDCAGLVTTGGTPALSRHLPAGTAPVLQRLFDQGCGILGKTNLHELACGGTTRNETYGYARTPYDSDRVAGGSSGGTAVAISARIAPAGLGTDTGASVRAPSAFCGIAALRPTVGPTHADRRYPTGGVVPISTTRDTIGPMARSVADVAIVDAAIMGRPVPEMADLNGLRVALPLDPFWRDLAPEVERTCWEAVRLLEKRGVVFKESAILRDANTLNQTASIADLWEFRQALPRYLEDGGSNESWESVFEQVAGPEVRAMMEFAATVTREQHQEALIVARTDLVSIYRSLYEDEGFDACLIPCTPILPPLATDHQGNVTRELAGRRLDEFNLIIRNLYASAGAGVPGVALPAGLSAGGLPVGIELGGPHSGDERLLSLAMAFEEVLGRLPPPGSDLIDG